jgi:hypothetical protein
MPITSKAQQRAMHAAASGKGKAGIPKKVAKKFIESTPKKAYASLPNTAPPRKVALKRKGGK